MCIGSDANMESGLGCQKLTDLALFEKIMGR
jgi:hypothetical protein